MAAFWLVLLLLCFPALTGHVAATPVVDVQLEALMAFKDSITEVQPGALAGWTTSSSAYRCAWEGVSCVRPFYNHTSDILSIDLSGRNLTGTISPFLGNISTLESLVLRKNSLHGALPPQLGNLKKLRHLDLGWNSLGGTIPSSICNISTLERLVLSRNSLHGALPPQLGNLKKLQYLSLSANNFTGQIPPEIKDLVNLLYLDVSANMLSGKLPVGLFFKLRSLWRLDLSRNKLTGELAVEEGVLIPQQLTYLDLSLNAFDGPIPKILESFNGLEYLNLSFNKFQGPVPEGGIFEHLDPSSLQGNLGLCGAKIHTPCKSNWLEPSSLQGNLGLCGAKIHTPCKSNWFSKNAPLVAALSSSLGLLLLLVTTAAIITKRYRRTRRMDHLETTDQILRAPCLKRFTEEDLEFATNFFSEVHVIGKSNWSTVYSGRLLEDGGRRVAVKKLNLHQFPSEHSSKCLLMELKTLGVLKHRNLVKVVGYAWEPPRLKALVLELMENGSLEDVIHGGAEVMFNNNRSRWKEVSERLRVCISVAGGLVYLHTGYDFPIVHCDLKPSNILFDQEWEAHVSDFGATRMLNIHHSSSGGGGSNMSTTSSFAFQFGTVGYMAPELAYMTKVTTKVDVFSFGVVIMEFLTGTRPTEVEGQVDGHPLSLPEFVAEAVAGGADGVLPVLDRDLELTSSRDVQVAVKLLQLGVTCSNAQVGARPDMSDVLSSLLKLTKEYH